MTILKRILYVVMSLGLILSVASAYAAADPLSITEQDALFNWPDWVAEGAAQCTANVSMNASSGGSNLDYAGHQILNSAELQAIAQNTPTYQQAAQQVGIPWQLLAAVHYRETGLKLYNPANGQGVYQITSQNFPPSSQISQNEFLQESIAAAQYLKSAASSNYAVDQNLSSNSDANTVKDTLFSYNGRASAYSQQAAGLGYNASTQGFEGSPYVMNKADAKRDPSALGPGEHTWGQILTDHGGLSYPANNDYGAFVIYADLAGLAITSGSGCSSSSVQCSGPAASGLSTVRQQIVCLTEQELSAWGPSGQYKPSTGAFKKYSQGRDEPWCADFVSWIYNQAGDPLTSSSGGNVPAVSGIQSIGQQGGKFTYHDVNGYTPQPGDLAIHGSGHVNIVISDTNGTITLIGGDQGSNNIETNVVSEYSLINPSADNPPITGYVSPN